MTTIVALPLLSAVGGFILLHATQIQPKNTTSVIIANLLSIAVGTIMFWATGFAFAFGPSGSSNFFLSYKPFFLIDASEGEYLKFGNECVFMMLVLVLGNSGFISRMRYWLYPVVAFFIAGFIYPCARHWTNSEKGWLAEGISVDIKGNQTAITYSDKGGAASIHIFSGTVSLISTIMLAPRKERHGKKFRPVGGNLTPLMLAGYFLVIIGMISKTTVFNEGGSVHLVLTNNLLACQSGALISFVIKRTGYLGDPSSTKALVNGSLAGLVAVCCLPSDYYVYGAFAVGVIGGIAYCVWTALLQLCRVDDPTDSIAVHLGCGLWAVIASPIFQRDNGILYNSSNKIFQMFGWHLLSGIAVFVWSGLCVFAILIIFVCARVAKHSGREAAEVGLDALEHKEPAYPDREQYTPDTTDQMLDDLFMKNSVYAYDNKATQQTVGGHRSIGAYGSDNYNRNVTKY